MKKPFLIVGLPRSRTAWFANYFFYGGRTCYHELISSCAPHDILSKLLPGNGNSDSALCFYPDLVIDLCNKKQVNLLIIRRNPNEALLSYITAAIKSKVSPGIIIAMIDAFPSFNEKLDKIISTVSESIMVVDYDKINQKMEAIHRFLTPEIRIDPVRLKQLIETNITQNLSITDDLVARKIK